MINMTNRPNVAMRLVTFKFRFGHPHPLRSGARAASNRGWVTADNAPVQAKFRTNFLT
jgi:hypothetical protein